MRRSDGATISTKEVATVMDIELLDAREQLVRAGAREQPVGTDGFRTLD